MDVSNDNGCSMRSSLVMIVNIEELMDLQIELFPNPMLGNSTLTFDTSSAKNIRLRDSQGKLVRIWTGITAQSIDIERGSLNSGKAI